MPVASTNERILANLLDIKAVLTQQTTGTPVLNNDQSHITQISEISKTLTNFINEKPEIECPSNITPP